MKVVDNPGGFGSACFAQRKEGGNTICHRYTKTEKVNILRGLEKLQLDQDMKLVDAATVLQVDPSCLTWWAQNNDDKLQCQQQVLVHSGPLGLLKDIEMDLCNYTEKWRQKGFEVNCFTLLRKAGQLRPGIIEKSLGAAKICISRFLAKNPHDIRSNDSVR